MGSPRNVLANTFRCGSSWRMPPLSPRAARNNAPFLLRDSAPPVFVSLWMIVASPVAGSSRMTLLASLFANSIVPLSPAMMPSALLPSHCQTTFHACPAAITPGIAVDAGIGGGSGGAGFVFCAMGKPKGGGGVLHLARTLLSPGLCHACWLLPRAKLDAGP